VKKITTKITGREREEVKERKKRINKSKRSKKCTQVDTPNEDKIRE
jgi:hypothetical protein